MAENERFAFWGRIFSLLPRAIRALELYMYFMLFRRKAHSIPELYSVPVPGRMPVTTLAPSSRPCCKARHLFFRINRCNVEAQQLDVEPLSGQCMDWDELPPENDEGCFTSFRASRRCSILQDASSTSGVWVRSTAAGPLIACPVEEWVHVSSAQACGKTRDYASDVAPCSDASGPPLALPGRR